MRTLLLLIAFASGVVPVGAQLAPPAPLQPLTEAEISGAFSHDRTFPELSNGALVSFARPIALPGPVPITITTIPNGRPTEVGFWLPEAAEIWPEDVARTADGNIVIAGWYTTQGDANESRKNFAAVVDRRGSLVTLVDLKEYSPQRVCSSSPSSFWILGQDADKEVLGKSYDLVRLYGIDGTQHGSYFPRSRLGAAVLDFESPGRALGHSVNTAQLACDSSEAAVYFGPGRMLAKIDTVGRLRTFVVQPVRNSNIRRMAILPDGSIYASFLSRVEAQASSKLYLLTTLNNSDGAAWVPVPAKTPVTLLGVQNTSLVYVPGMANGAVSHPVIAWANR